MSAIANPLPDDVLDAMQGIVAFAEKEVLPRHRQHQALFDNPRALYGEDGRFSDALNALIGEVRQTSAAAGFYQMCVPEHLGGGGLGHLAYYAAWQALFHRCGPQNWLMLYVLAHWAFGPSKLLDQVTDEALDKFMPGLLDGSQSMCFGLSEPNAGSDASMIRTSATKEGDGWRINGRKIWTTNAPVADYCVLFAVTDAERAAAKKGGITGFMVPTTSSGFNVSRIIKLFGHIGGDEAELEFEDLYVEPWQVVGELGKGFAASPLRCLPRAYLQ